MVVAIYFLNISVVLSRIKFVLSFVIWIVLSILNILKCSN